MMDLFTWFDALCSFNVSIEIVALTILASLMFGITVGSSEELAFPNVLNALLFFSFFLLLLLTSLFGFDFTNVSLNTYYFSQRFQMLFLILAAFITLVTRDFLTSRLISKFEYDIISLFVFLSLICLCFADDFLVFYLAIELQSLCFYVLATFNRGSEFSTESGLKYFIFGAIISCLLLLGFSIIYISFGSISFESLRGLAQPTSNPFLYAGYIFILIALLFKVGSAPFHSWLCDVYDGAPICVTLLFAAVPKVIIFSVMIKLFLLTFIDSSIVWSPIFLFASILSIAIGSISAIYQKRLKRLFAYSTISHTGFLLLGFVCACVDSTSALIFYIVIYSCLTILLFSLFIYAIITQMNFPAFIANWTSSGLRNYVFVISLTLVLFSISGIPPLAGFFSKLMILLSLISHKYFTSCLVIVIISSVASFYYIRLIKTFFFVKTSKVNFWISTTKRLGAELNIGLLLFLNLSFCFYPEFLSLFATSLSLTLF